MSQYTIARYEYNIAAGIAHASYALEKLNPDGSRERVAALHGMATDVDGRPQAIGMPWDAHTIKVHVYSDRDLGALGLARPANVSQPEYDANGPYAALRISADFLADSGADSARRSDLGPMTQAEAVALFQKGLDLGAVVNSKNQPYSIFDTNSNSVAMHMGEVFGDERIADIDGLGQSADEWNKPGWGVRIVSPQEVFSGSGDSAQN